MRKEGEIRKWIETLEKERETKGPIHRAGEHRKKGYKTSFAMGLRGG